MKDIKKYIDALSKLAVIKENLSDNKEGVKDIDLVIEAVVREMDVFLKNR